MLIGEDHVWFGFESERLVPGWIVVRVTDMVNKREKQRKEEIVGFHFLLFSSCLSFEIC